jgi:hypothetical protein
VSTIVSRKTARPPLRLYGAISVGLESLLPRRPTSGQSPAEIRVYEVKE